MSPISISGLWETLLDIVLPRSPQEREVLFLSPSEIIRRTPLIERLPSWQHAVLAYRHPLAHTLINLLKYKNSHKAAEMCAELMWHELPYLLADSLHGERYLLVPIPTSRARLRERGYNQTERIGKKILALQGASAPLTLSPILIKTRETQPQTGTRNRSERLANLKNSFGIKKGSLVKGVRIILIDDVITTGATLEEAKRVLEKAGAKEVLALVIAH